MKVFRVFNIQFNMSHCRYMWAVEQSRLGIIIHASNKLLLIQITHSTHWPEDRRYYCFLSWPIIEINDFVIVTILDKLIYILI